MSGWTIGFLLGGAVTLVVVLLVALLIVWAARIAATAERIQRELERAEEGTRGLWGLRTTHEAAERVVEALHVAAGALPGEGAR